MFICWFVFPRCTSLTLNPIFSPFSTLKDLLSVRTRIQEEIEKCFQSGKNKQGITRLNISSQCVCWHILKRINFLLTLLDTDDAGLVEFVLQDPLLYGDFRNAMDDGEDRFYEDQNDFDNVFTLFTEVFLQKKIFFHGIYLFSLHFTSHQFSLVFVWIQWQRNWSNEFSVIQRLFGTLDSGPSSFTIATVSKYLYIDL